MSCFINYEVCVFLDVICLCFKCLSFLMATFNAAFKTTICNYFDIFFVVKVPHGKCKGSKATAGVI